ncbi:ATP-dependent RNA helicase DOB1 (mRNA transport regulator MTR4) [Durusdinium trenchii]|uniref:ATP-dependent RNA helicase DOB1 (mRNA transport regulator MTR4) n=1 Tax=Durusdinium trenchii TaxID=1381693 RepID=A0ABP0PAU6_9DINO
MHGLIRACNCHVQIADDLSFVDVFATTSRIAEKARRIFGLSPSEFNETTAWPDGDAMPEDCVEQENPESIQVRWTTHPSRQTFVHRTVRPSFISTPLIQSFYPSLHSWSFQHELDPVQSAAIACVEHRESVLLCAPTSAGKTVVATYAVAMALHETKRAIYTTPIKALSNQKFLELGKSFGAQYIGIMTGDTVIASDAPIVVMTLEILQSMLYKQARDPNLLDDFAFVVVDEAHFLGDVERGYAWEEVLVLLPLHVKLVLLSATVPNAGTVAEWCSRVRTEPVHVLTSEQRPVPLSHDLFRCEPPDFFGRRRSFFSVLSPHKRFNAFNLREAVRQRGIILESQATWRCPQDLIPHFVGRRGQNLKQLMAGLAAAVHILDGGGIEVRASDSRAEEEAKSRITAWLVERGLPEAMARPPNTSGDPLSLRVEDLERLLSLLWYRDQLPTIGFCFDKRMCERVALLLAGAKRMDFSSNFKKNKIRERLRAGLARLDERDKQLAQVRHSCDLLVRGIGVHHGGMLPLLREMVELLFADGLLPVIFATETFAIGLNMPAKSVIFTDVVKFDGRSRRVLNSGEFRQMSGRAGRRGLDQRGHVYVMLHNTMILKQTATTVLERLYIEEPSGVESRYRVCWSSLLHLISAGPAHLFTMLYRSFQRFTNPNAAIALQQEATWMVKVLQELDFVDKSCAILPKGTLACHLFVPEDALLVTNVLIALRGFENLSAAQAFAICAAFVAEGSDNKRLKISDLEVRKGLETCRNVARSLAAKLHSHNLPCCSKCGLLRSSSRCDGSEMIKVRVNPQLCETALQWASGQDFTSAVLSSGVAVGGEGIVTRALRRLDELMREITFVLRHDLGSPQAAQRIQDARLLARRGVLAAPSAYLGEAEDRVAEEIEAEPPWPNQTWPPGYEGHLDPLDIGFSQANCSANFQCPPVRGGPGDILGLAKGLSDGSIFPSQVRPLSIYWFRHRYYSLDNRRLAAFRLWRLFAEDAKVPVKVLNRSQALSEHWLRKFSTGFTGGRKIRIRGSDLFVGATREQCTFGNNLWA